MSQWNLSVRLSGQGSDLATTLRNSSTEARKLKRDIDKARQSILQLRAAASEDIQIGVSVDASNLRQDVQAAVQGAGGHSIDVQLSVDGDHLRDEVNHALTAAGAGQGLTVDLALRDSMQLRRDVTAAVRWAAQGHRILIPIGLADSMQLRRDVTAAVRWAQMGQSITIPVTLDTAHVLPQLTALTAGLNGASGAASGLGGNITGLAALATALVPIAASIAPIATTLAGAGVSMGVFGAALAGQVSALSDAAEAQTKYEEAVRDSGPTSQEAAEAAMALQAQMASMPAPTREASAALASLKNQYQDWSDSLAGDTMPVVTKGFQTLSATIPKLTPMVKGAADQMDRLVTITAGGVASGGFDALLEKFEGFANLSIREVTDQIVHLMRVLSEGTGGSTAFQEVMDYARQVGPQVAQLLRSVGDAFLNVLDAASQMGVTALSIVNILAQLVSAVPSGVITVFLQLALALKAVQLAAAGMGAISGLVAAFATQLAAARTAAAGAAGPLASAAAGFMALSRAAKVAVIGTAIGALVIALSELSNIGKSAPPDVDKLTTSLGNLAKTGKVAGEAARVFGKDLSGLGDALRTLARPSNAEKTQQFLTSLIGMDSTPVKNAAEKFDGLDKSLSNLVKGGKADIAAAALNRSIKNLEKQGFTAKEVRGQLDDYKSALADAKFEQELAADAMGLFGQQAIATSAKLDAQKASADGLRQSIQALNDVNRQGMGGMIGFEAAIDAAAKAATENAGALEMSGGKLNLNSEKARNAATALNDLAAKTDEAAGAARQSGASWEEVSGIYTRGRTALVSTARQMGLTKSQAEALADSILTIPDKKSTKIEMQREDALAGLESVTAKLAATPGKKTVTVDAMTSEAQLLLESVGFKTKTLPNGKVQVTAATAGAKANLDNLIGQIKNVPGGKTIAMAAATGGAIRDLENLKTAVGKQHGKTITMRVPTEEGRRQLELLGFKIRGTKGKNVTVTVPTGTARGQAAAIQSAINALHGKTITIRTNRVESITHINSRPKGPSGQPLWNARGSLVDYYANGGIQRGGVRHFASGAEQHVAQFAPAGTWRVWAEPETGGEAYIPLAPAKRDRSRKIAEETVKRLGGKGIAWNADGSVTNFASGGFSYTPTGTMKSASDVQSSYSNAHQSITKDDYNKTLRSRANAVDTLRSAEARLRQVRRHKHTHAQLVSAENSVAKARRSLATATEKARTAESRYKKTFSLSDWSKTLSSAAKSSASYEKNLSKIASRGGSDVIGQLRDMGAEGATMVSALAKASKSQFNSIVANLRKLAPLAKATLADYTKQLNGSNKTSASFQANLAKLAGMGYGDLATQLAGQGDDAAQKVAAEAVKSRSSAAQANSAAKTAGKTLSGEELEQLVAIIAAVKSSKTGLHDVAGTTGLGEDAIITIATKAKSQIAGSLGSRAAKFLSDLGKAQRGLAYADGGIRPGIYGTRAGAVTFAEPQTGGEAFIPLGANKRSKATNVLSDVAGRFGLGLQDASAGRVVIVREQGPLVGAQHWHIDGNRRDLDFAREVESRTARQMRRLARGGAAAR